MSLEDVVARLLSEHPREVAGFLILFVLSIGMAVGWARGKKIR